MDRDDAVRNLAHEYGLSADLKTPFGGDQPRTAQQLADILTRAGFSCQTADEASSSLARLRRQKYGNGGLKFSGTMTCRTEHPGRIRFICPERFRHATLRWHVRPKKGGVSTPINGTISIGDGRVIWELDFLPGCVEMECVLFNHLPIGEYDLEVTVADERPAKVRLFCAPERAPAIPSRAWGYVAQLPTMVSTRNCGRGEFPDLVQVAEAMAKHHGRYLGVTPFQLSEGHPYFNSTIIGVDPTQMSPLTAAQFLGNSGVEEWLTKGDGKRRIRELRQAPFVDADGVRALCNDVTARLWEEFDAKRFPEFHRFTLGRPYVKALGVFLAKREAELQQRADGWDFRTWGSLAHGSLSGRSEVTAYASEHQRQVELHIFRQWLARQQLEQVRDRCDALGVGLYLDIPVSAAPGFEEWLWPGVYPSGLECGAPGDAFNEGGQAWGSLPRWLVGLRECGYEPVVLAFEEIMRLCKIARLDHFMIVQRIFALLRNGAPNNGAYLYGCMEEILDILVLKAHEFGCAVVGEDLGTVDEAVRKAMAERGIYRMPIMMFERGEHGSFNEAAHYPADGVSSWASHDLPSPSAWLRGLDLYHAAVLGHREDRRTAEQVADRRRDVGKLLERLGLDDVGDPLDLTCAIYRFLAEGPSQLVMVHCEDLAPAAWQPNVPGTATALRMKAYPNYGVRFPFPVERLGQYGEQLFAMLATLRP